MKCGDNEYEIVKYRPEFKSQVLALQTHLWSPDLAVNSAYLEWKYERNPYLQTPLIYLALREGQVVGMRGTYGAKWQISKPSQKFLGLCAGDLVIDPDHRNRGIFTQLMRFAMNDLAERGYTYIFDLSAGRVTYIGSLTMGWRGLGPLQAMHWQAERSSPAEKSTDFMSNDEASNFRKASNRVSLEQRPRPKAMAELGERIGSDGRMCHVRDERYFSWRFQNPLSTYRFLFWEDVKLEGYLVLGRSRYRKTTQLNIVDWEATNAQVRTELLETAIVHSNFQHITIWSATLQDETKKLLEHTSFNPENRISGLLGYMPSLLIRKVNPEKSDADWVLGNRRLLDLANWDLRMIYSDGY